MLIKPNAMMVNANGHDDEDGPVLDTDSPRGSPKRDDKQKDQFRGKLTLAVAVSGPEAAAPLTPTYQGAVDMSVVVHSFSVQKRANGLVHLQLSHRQHLIPSLRWAAVWWRAVQAVHPHMTKHRQANALSQSTSDGMTNGL